jgi:phosphatidylethanolamine-binding protein (PEBP) family uncharacterized protein
MKKIGLLLFVSFLSISCKKDENTILNVSNSTDFKAFSSEYSDKGNFPVKYTCDGAGISPFIQWSGAPTGTTNYAITIHHFPPTGDKHVYMSVFNIGSNIKEFPENATNIGTLGVNTVNGKNAYAPPCSQGPGIKTYIITVYALSSAPLITTSANQITMDVLLAAISNKTLAKSEILVNYSRP